MREGIFSLGNFVLQSGVTLSDAKLSYATQRAIVMPCRTDLYFPPEDSEVEVKHMPNAELRPFESIYGHFAAGWTSPSDMAFHESALRELLGD